MRQLISDCVLTASFWGWQLSDLAALENTVAGGIVIVVGLGRFAMLIYDFRKKLNEK